MAIIKLTQGKEAIVDDELFAWLNRWKWYYKKQPDGDGGYACRNEYVPKHRTLRMHAVINQTPLGMRTDHINGNKLDNRQSNLRTATSIQNARNTTRPHKNNTSGHKGIYWHKRDKAWRVQLTVNYKKLFIGNYTELEEAIKARDAAYKKYHGGWASF